MDSNVGYGDEPELVSINLFVYHENFTPLAAIPVSLIDSSNNESLLSQNVTDLTGHATFNALEEDCLNLQSININEASSFEHSINPQFSSSVISRKLIEPFCNSFGPPDERILYVKLTHMPQAKPYAKPTEPAILTPQTTKTPIDLAEVEQPVVLIVTLILLLILSLAAALIVRRCCQGNYQPDSEDSSSSIDDDDNITDVIEHKHEVTLSESVEVVDLDKLTLENGQSNNQINNQSNIQSVDQEQVASPPTPVQETVTTPLIQPIIIRETFAWRSGQAPRVNIQR